MAKSSRSFSAADGFEPAHLTEAARDHFRAARVLFGKDDPFVFDSAGYLAHIAVELLLKAALLDLTGSFPAEHNLEKLARLLTANLPGFEFTQPGLRILRLLNEFGELRYPSPKRPIEIGSDDVDSIVRLFSQVWFDLPEEIRPPENPKGSITKGGRVLMRKPVGRKSDA